MNTSIFERALGDDFSQLHPKIQERFGFTSSDHIAQIGRGTMHQITRGSALTVPFTCVGATRNLLFPERGVEVPFTIANYAYVDSFGRETVTFHRQFDFANMPRVFDATMIFSDKYDVIVDYLGTHQHIATELDCWADDEGGINFVSLAQRIHEGPIHVTLPRHLGGRAVVREWWDETIGRYRIRVRVDNPIVGHVIGYDGTFDNTTRRVDDPGDIPKTVMPRREQPLE